MNSTATHPAEGEILLLEVAEFARDILGPSGPIILGQPSAQALETEVPRWKPLQKEHSP